MSEEEIEKKDEKHKNEIDSYKIERSLLSDAYFQLKETTKKLETSEERFRRLAENSPDVIYRMSLPSGVYEYISPAILSNFGYSPDEFYNNPLFIRQIVSENWKPYIEKQWENLLKGEVPPVYEYQVVRKDGQERWVNQRNILVRDTGGTPIAIEGIVTDVTERKESEEVRQVHLRFMESVDKVNRAIQGSPDLEQMMKNVLDAVLNIFECDRAWLLTPSDPWVTSYRVPMERVKPGYAGALALGIEVPVDPETVLVLQKARATDGPVVFDTESDPPIPSELVKRFNIQSQIVMDIYPKTGGSWMFGLHQCSYRRAWTKEEKALFQEIGRRITDALTALLAYKELHKKEEEYARIVETANEGILVIDKNQKFVFANTRLLQMGGYTQKELLSHRIDEYIVPEERSAHEVEIKKRTEGQADVYTRRFLRKDGGVVICRVSAVPIFNNKKEYDGSFAMLTDITESIRTEERLNEQIKFSESLLRFSRRVEQSQSYGEVLVAAQEEIKIIIGYTNVWAYRISEDKKYAYSIVATGSTADVVMSEEGTAVLKIEGDPMLEAIASAKDIVIVEDAQVDPNVNKEIVKKLGNRTLVNVPIILFDRNLGSVGMGTFGDEGVRAPTKSEQEYLIAMASHMAVGFDRIRLLGERMKTLETLRQNADELKEAQRIGKFGSFEWDSKADIATWSEEFYHIFGVDISQKPVGFKEYLKFFTPDSAAAMKIAVDKILLTGEPFSINLELVRPDGSRRWINVQSEVKRDAHNNIVGVRGTAQDITKAKELEKMRVDFLSLASHQLRTPLSGTRWLIETLTKGLPGPLTESQKEYLGEIYKINDRMTRLVSDMLSALRVESIDAVLVKTPISIQQLFDDLLLSAGAAAKSKNITVRNLSAEHAVPALKSDANFLSIILGTFLSNAINYSPGGKEVIFDAKEEDGGIVFTVQDFGIGVPTEDQEHIFDRFFRSQNAKIIRPEGTGLGLYIANILAVKLGGSITFSSTVGQGSTFALHLHYRE